MATGRLTIDLDAICANWRSLDALSGAATQTAAVVKADAYGLHVAPVAQALAKAGVKIFFVAAAEEGAALRKALGAGPQINVLSGHMAGDTDLLRDHALTPMLNSTQQISRHVTTLPQAPFGIQLDTGMNRLGLEPAEWAAVKAEVLAQSPTLLMSHLACADTPADPLNAAQLASFKAMTDGLGIQRSLAATGGVLLGPDYHFDVTRPGVGLYGGLPYAGSQSVVQLDLPVIQTRMVEAGEYVGYSLGHQCAQPTKVATIAAGYADGLSRALSAKVKVWAGDQPCQVLGRISMDLITVDVSHLATVPDYLTLLGPQQGIDAVADVAKTIGYEILTSLGGRYSRTYLGQTA